MNSLLEDLTFRNLINQATNLEDLSKRMDEGPITMYIGFDPTADSLHIGSLLPILCLRRFQQSGHNVIALVGGATGLIGDPSGRKSERTLNTLDVVQGWSDKIRAQVSRFLDFDGVKNPARLVNNYDWTKDLDLISFLRDIGKNFSVNYMLAKDSVDSRMERGISFTEFSYMILQAFDFWNLHKESGCQLQMGGSDQWGNITAGIELVRKLEGEEVFGLTVPLVTKADGEKFGKTASGAVWLDESKTSPYQFYQFWLNVDDRDAVPFLKYFTFLTKTEIEELEREVGENPGARQAQRILAREVTTLVHGQEAMLRAEKISQILFQGDLSQLTAAEIEDALSDVPSSSFAKDAEMPLVELLVDLGACSSKRQAREDIQNGAVLVNGSKRTDPASMVLFADKIGGTTTVIRRGKRNYFLARFE